MFKHFTIASIIMCSFAVTLHAADAPEVEVPETSSVVSFEETISNQYNIADSSDSNLWDGIYLGFNLSLDSNIHNEFWRNGNFDNGPHSIDETDNLASYSIGFNKQSGDLLYGAEFSFMPKKIYDGDFQSYKNPIDIKLRAGHIFNKNLLLYGIAGVSSAYYKEDYTSNYEISGGFNGGFGVEYKISQNVFIGTEFLSRNMNSSLSYPDLSGWEVKNAKLDTLSVRIGTHLNNF